MLFFDRCPRDYEVTGEFNDVSGKRIVTKRVCHNVSKREATQRMRDYVKNEYNDSIDVYHPIKINTKVAD